MTVFFIALNKVLTSGVISLSGGAGCNADLFLWLGIINKGECELAKKIYTAYGSGVILLVPKMNYKNVCNDVSWHVATNILEFYEGV